MNNFLWLEQWFQTQCESAWERSRGIVLETLDTPGWQLSIDLNKTPYGGLQNVSMKQLHLSESEWMICRMQNGVFLGSGGPLMLGPIVQTFRNWIEGFAR